MAAKKTAAGAALPRGFSLIRLEPRGDGGGVPRQLDEAEQGSGCRREIRAAVHQQLCDFRKKRVFELLTKLTIR